VQVLPGPPPVSRCGICCSILGQFNLLSGLMGCTPTSINCNSRCGCTCAIPIESRSPTALASIVVAQNKEHARSLLGHRPSSSSCLLVSSRTASKLQPLLKSCTLIHTFMSDTSLGQHINSSSKPSPILAFHVPPDIRESGSCSVLAQAALEDCQLEMVFTGFVRDRAMKVLMDSGASSCFIGKSMVQKHGLVIRPSCLKSVATAAGRNVSILGAVTFQLQLGPAVVEVTAHILPDFLPQVHLILGEDFMQNKTNNISLRYNPSRCIIFSETPNEVVLERSHTCQVMSHKGGSDVESNDLPNLISPAQAARYIKRNPLKAFVALIKPYALDPGVVASTIASGSEPLVPHVHLVPPHVHCVTPNLDLVPPHLLGSLTSLFEEYSDIFSETPLAGGALVDTLEHTIKLVPGAKPTFRKNFRFSPIELQELRKQVTDFLAKGIITPSNSPFGAPVLFVPKPNGGLRFCLDYRALNAITIKSRYQLPRIDDLLDSARGAEVFSSLDLAGGFHQLRIADSDCEKTAFATPFGHFEWRVLSMGLTNSPSSFMSTMQQVFEDYVVNGKSPAHSCAPGTTPDLCDLRKFLLIYLDDILIMSSSPTEHLHHLRLVFERLRKHRFQVKLSKCNFFQEQIKYLGHILSRDGIRVDPAKVKTLLDWEFPTSCLGVQQFLGLANYFRKHIPNFSRLSAPLYALTKKSSIFLKGEESLLAFAAIKKLLIEPPVLAYPNPDLPYEIISDASITGCGAILVQEGRPVAYFSSRYSSAERNYTTGEQELLGIIKALKEWRCYVEGCQGLTLVTDHNPLTFFSVQPTLSRRQARWSEFLSRFHYEVKYSPGASNPADSLSRLYGNANAVASMVFALTISEFKSDLLDRIKVESNLDPHFKDESVTRPYVQQSGYWTYQDRIVVPASMQIEIIKEHHSNVVSGHFSWSRTVDLISRQFWWPKMRPAVQDFVKSCLSCQRNKSSTQRPFGLLSPLDIPDSRWHTVTMDWIMDLPPSAQGNNAIMVIVDKLTKYVHLVPTTKESSSEDVARLFIAHVYQYHGLPKVLISDRDTRFTSGFWRSFCKHLGMQPRYSTAFHPQTDGQTERTNRVLEEVLRHFIDGEHKQWEELLPLAAFAMNNAKSSSTGETPFFLNHGCHPATPVSLGLPEGKLPSLDAVFKDLEFTHSKIRELLKSAQDRQKAYADARFRRPHDFKKDDFVLLSTRNLKFKTGKKKLHPKFIGPFKILDMVPGSNNAARLALPASYSRIHPVFHVSLLKPYHVDVHCTPPTPEPLVEDGVPMYSVEKILSTRVRRNGKRKVQEFLIKWLGYDDAHNSWEPRKNLTADLLQDYPLR